MYRCPAVSICVLALWLSGTSVVCSGEKEKSPAPTAQKISVKTSIEKALNKKTTVEFEGIALSLIVEKLAKKHAIPIVIDHDALDEVGESAEWPVTIHASDISLRDALNLMLHNRELSWTIRDDALLITTKQAVKNFLYTKSYNVGDIVTGRDEQGKPVDGSKSLVECITSLLDLDRNRKIEGMSIAIIDAKDGKQLSLTHNRWVHEDTADLLNAIESTIKQNKPDKRTLKARDKINAALSKPVAMEFIEMPLHDLIDYLKKQYKIEIQVDNKTGDYLLDTDVPITINLKGISLRSALSLMLKNLGLTYIIQDGVLLITAPENTVTVRTIRTYDIADLVSPHDKTGNIEFSRDELKKSIYYHTTQDCESLPISMSCYSNGGVQMLACRMNAKQHEDADWLLKEIHKIGRREAVQSQIPDGAEKTKPRQPKILSTILSCEEAIQKALSRKESLEFTDTPLFDVLDYLKDAFKIEIQLDNRGLADCGIGGDMPVTLKTSSMSLRDTLKRILGPHDLAWTIRDEVLLITSHDEAESFLVTKVYAVADLPDSLLPLKTKYNHFGIRGIVSSDTVRALVVVEPYSSQEKVAAWLIAARDPLKRDSLKQGGQKPLKADVKNLKQTIITPHLKQEIPENTNVLWCNTFQLAWNELCDLAGGPIKMDKPPKMLSVMNRREASKADLDETSYVAAAGLTGDGIYERIQQQLQDKFGKTADPQLFEESRKSNMAWVTYGYLSKQLPFQWAFTRFHDNMRFAGERVDSFGILQYLKFQKDEARMASQVAVLDYQNTNDFVIELKTQAENDRLILAKISPKQTLGDTIAAVEKRVAGKKPMQMEEDADLFIPVFDFDLSREYNELIGKLIQTNNQKLDGTPIIFAAQSIRFRLDETGAVLESEAIMAGAIYIKNLVFDKPFLILLKRRGAERPYFALWVGNAELMVSSDDFQP